MKLLQNILMESCSKSNSEQCSCISIVLNIDISARIHGMMEIRGINKAGHTTTEDACGWAGAVIERRTQEFGQEQ